jgi:hypothetical protein
MKFDSVEFTRIDTFQFWSKPNNNMGTLHEDLHLFLWNQSAAQQRGESSLREKLRF